MGERLENFFGVVKKRFNGYNEEDSRETVKCPRCQSLILLERYEELHRVCPNCNYHGRLSTPERIEIIFDKNSFKELDRDMVSCDPIEFPDYGEKQQENLPHPDERPARREHLQVALSDEVVLLCFGDGIVSCIVSWEANSIVIECAMEGHEDISCNIKISEAY